LCQRWSFSQRPREQQGIAEERFVHVVDMMPFPLSVNVLYL
jgi:hypothetical protein